MKRGSGCCAVDIYCTAALTSLSDSVSYITFLFSEWRITVSCTLLRYLKFNLLPLHWEGFLFLRKTALTKRSLYISLLFCFFFQKDPVPHNYDKNNPEYRHIYRFIKTLFNAAQLTAECAIITLVSIFKTDLITNVKVRMTRKFLFFLTEEH